MSRSRFAATLMLSVMINGCAADKASGPAQTLSKTVSTFQADMSAYQKGITTYQSAQQSFASGNNAARDEATAATQRLQVEWQLRTAGDPGKMFAVLQTQGTTAIAALVAPPAAPQGSTSATLPLDKLGSVVKTLDEIGKAPGTKADAAFLVKYGEAVNDQLNTLNTAASSAKPPPAAPGAAK